MYESFQEPNNEKEISHQTWLQEQNSIEDDVSLLFQDPLPSKILQYEGR